ncbi:MAG TPA: flagellar basal body-associated FliL family protein [Egibacteraceae bacterium]
MAKTKTAPAPPTAPSAAAPRRRSTLTIVVAGVLVGLAVGAAAYLVLLKPNDPAAATEVPAAPEEGEIVDVAELTVNVRGDGLRYARVGFAVVLAADASADAVTPDLPLLKDAAISEIGRFTAEQLRTPEGGDALRSALTKRAARLWPDGEVLRVVLTSLVVQ